MSSIFTRVGRAVLVSSLLCGGALAAAIDFDFKDPKGVNTVHFLLDSELEPIMGLSSGVSGTVSFDPDDPKKTTGKILIAATSVLTQNKGMNDALHGSDWLDVKANPEISFTFKEVKDATKSADGVFEMTVAGDFLCKGITKPVTTKVRAAYLKDKLGNRMRGKKGDLLVLRSEFTIKRSDFELNKATPSAIVAEDIQITATIVGSHEQK